MIWLYIMSAFYILAGILHFARPGMYMNIMPEYLPFPLLLVYMSGILEVLSGVLLLFPQFRNIGAWLTIFTLIVVFPANIQMMTDFYKEHNPYLWVAVLRLPLQLLLIYWAWTYTR